MRHPKAMEWEERLKSVFDRIDGALEEHYGQQYRLHPSRPEHGVTSNPEQDGLFNVGAVFSAGFGTTSGPGYIVELRLATLDQVPESRRNELEDEVADLLRRELPSVFPGKRLRVEREGEVYKIIGDLDLGMA